MNKRDTIDVKYFCPEEPENNFYDGVILILNGEDVSGCFDAMSLVLSSHVKRSVWEILTCSCGIGGCAGIFDGTSIKTRRYTVEWRDIDSGLPKRFYSFDKKEYNEAVQKTMGIMRVIAKKRESLPPETDDDYRYDGVLNFWSVKDLDDRIQHAIEWYDND